MSDQDIHRKCSVNCFNGVWDLLDKDGRTTEEDQLMREMAHASLFHGMSREDKKPMNLSIGFWQVSRVYSVLGQADAAASYAEECVAVSQDLNAFCRGYACEAAARAAKVGGDESTCEEWIAKAVPLLEEITDQQDRDLLATDLDSLA
ncbi:MAG: hypothetical protein HRU46_21170 [Verrucomicrobiales bacterium]|nr:hypothetical protein [Verrucomicrobiales bacterium]